MKRHATMSQQSRATGLALLAGIVLVLSLGAFTLWHGGTSVSGQGTSHAPRFSHHTRQPLSTDDQNGVAGVKPHLKLSADGKNDLAVSGLASQATYTAADAATYAMAHSVDTPITPLTAADVTVEFMTDAAAGKALNNISIGQSATRVVCVVQMRGEFSAYEPFGGAGGYDPATGKTNPAAMVKYAYLVFDGITGNLLDSSGSNVPYLK